MALNGTLRSDLAESMKRGDEPRVGVLRLMLAALANEEIAKRTASGGALGEEDEIRVLKREAKKRREAMELYEQGGRPDLRAKEEAELAVISAFLPKELSRDEAREIVFAVVLRSGASEFGSAMKEAVKEIGGRADGATVAEFVREALRGDA